MSVALEKLQLENIVRYFSGRAKNLGLQMPVGGPNSDLDGPAYSEEALIAYKLRLNAWISQVVPEPRKDNFDLIQIKI